MADDDEALIAAADEWAQRCSEAIQRRLMIDELHAHRTAAIWNAVATQRRRGRFQRILDVLDGLLAKMRGEEH